MKLNSADFQQGGFTPAEAVAVSVLLEESGSVDLIEISGGNYEAGASVSVQTVVSSKRLITLYVMW